MRHGVADEAHAAQHQEYADRSSAERERKRADQRAAHEGKFEEGREEIIVNHAAHSCAPSSNASHMRRAFRRFSAVSTSLVAPHATGSRASNSASGNIDLT